MLPRITTISFEGLLVVSLIVLQLVACLLVADFITGVVHWWEDCYGLPSWPLIGKEVIEPNIEHHRNPGLMGTVGGIIDRNYQSFVLFSIVAFAAILLGVFCWQLVVVGIFASFGNEVHLWSHRGGNGPIVRFLQDACIVQTPAQHARHHKPPFDKYYCTITNVTNAVLERIAFWRALEWLISKAGVHPKRMTAERSFL